MLKTITAISCLITSVCVFVVMQWIVGFWGWNAFDIDADTRFSLELSTSPVPVNRFQLPGLDRLPTEVSADIYFLSSSLLWAAGDCVKRRNGRVVVGGRVGVGPVR